MPYDTPEIGDRYLVAADPMNFIVFTRCTAIGYIELEKAYLQEGYSFDWLISHAQNLDERLESIACK